ncbi:MAG: hypothetical protein ACI35Z_15025 [Sphingobacterium hotanense]
MTKWSTARPVLGTQLNGIGHIGMDIIYYDRNKAIDFVTVEGVRRLGVEKVPPVVTRAVLLDVVAITTNQLSQKEQISRFADFSESNAVY